MHFRTIPKKHGACGEREAWGGNEEYVNDPWVELWGVFSDKLINNSKIIGWKTVIRLICTEGVVSFVGVKF